MTGSGIVHSTIRVEISKLIEIVRICIVEPANRVEQVESESMIENFIIFTKLPEKSAVSPL